MTTPELVDFWAPWCGPCRTLMPTLERVVDSHNGALKLAKVNTDEEPALSQMFGIRSLPTVVLFKDGKPVDGFMGAQPEGAIRAFLAKHLTAQAQAALEDELDAVDTDAVTAPDLEERILLAQEKMPEAIAIYKECVVLDSAFVPRTPEEFAILATALSAVEPKLAISLLQNFCRHYPKSKIVPRNLLLAAKILAERLNDVAGAKKLVMQLQPKFPESLHIKAINEYGLSLAGQ